VYVGFPARQAPLLNSVEQAQAPLLNIVEQVASLLLNSVCFCLLNTVIREVSSMNRYRAPLSQTLDVYRAPPIKMRRRSDNLHTYTYITRYAPHAPYMPRYM